MVTSTAVALFSHIRSRPALHHRERSSNYAESSHVSIVCTRGFTVVTVVSERVSNAGAKQVYVFIIF